MKAWTIHRYGSPDALAFEDVTKPEIAANEVLVHVRAASLSPYDWCYLRADPSLVRLSHGGILVSFGPPLRCIRPLDLSHGDLDR